MSLADQPAPVSVIAPVRRIAELRAAWLEMDRNAAAIQFAASRRGGLMIGLAVVVLLAASLQVSLPNLALAAIVITGVVLVPARRMEIVTAASVLFFVARPFRIEQWRTLTDAKALGLGFDGDLVRAAGALAFLAFAASFLALQRHASESLANRRPLLSLIMVWLALFLGALAIPSGSGWSLALWTMTGVWVSSLWMLAYAAMDQRAARPSVPAYARAAMARPFWGGGAEGIGKSWGYLAKFDAKTPDDLGVTRLKALKLAVWAVLLTGLWQACAWAFRDQLGLHDIDTAVLAHAAGQGGGLVHAWASLVTSYLIDLIIIAVWGHLIVAVVRMLGWRIPRNTRNPLASRTLAEFWNRYFFYFKEMLVDFFFYPAFQRWFKTNPKLRIAFATFCAAGAGNLMFHVMRETHVFASVSLEDGLMQFRSALFYSLMLALGLMISQWRGVKLSPDMGFWRWHVWPRVTVFAFFCLLKIFDDLTGIGTFEERARFALSLTGVFP
ncbi:MAG: hypothetical protein MUC58_13120 [Rhizobiaceae bacterium]|jgi:hypothetical protein|nr:hypothetical protein [Rhizobiaceae bacterium]